MTDKNGAIEWTGITDLWARVRVEALSVSGWKQSCFYTYSLLQFLTIVFLSVPFDLRLQEASRREALKSAGVAFGAAFVPAAANAAAGESPRFSVFGLIGDGTAYSEGGAYGSDQSSPTYSPYSVYGKVGDPGGLYKEGSPEYVARSKGVLAETKKRLAKIPAYADAKKWYEVRNELDRYMYETRGATRKLAQSPAQKKAATDFFKAIEKTDFAARTKDGAAVIANAKDASDKLDAFVSTIGK